MPPETEPLVRRSDAMEARASRYVADSIVAAVYMAVGAAVYVGCGWWGVAYLTAGAVVGGVVRYRWGFALRLAWSRLLDVVAPRRDYTGQRCPRITTLSAAEQKRYEEILRRRGLL